MNFPYFANNGFTIPLIIGINTKIFPLLLRPTSQIFMTHKLKERSKLIKKNYATNEDLLNPSLVLNLLSVSFCASSVFLTIFTKIPILGVTQRIILGGSYLTSITADFIDNSNVKLF